MMCELGVQSLAFLPVKQQVRIYLMRGRQFYISMFDDVHIQFNNATNIHLLYISRVDFASQ